MRSTCILLSRSPYYQVASAGRFNPRWNDIRRPLFNILTTETRYTLQAKLGMIPGFLSLNYVGYFVRIYLTSQVTSYSSLERVLTKVGRCETGRLRREQEWQDTNADNVFVQESVHKNRNEIYKLQYLFYITVRSRNMDC